MSETDSIVAGPEVDAAVAVEVMEWEWMSWVGIPVRRASGYPARCRVRQLASPRMLESREWQKMFAACEGSKATGDEPLSYAHCSSQFSGDSLPSYSIYWSAAAEVLEKLYRDGPYKTGWSPCLARQNDGQWVCTLHNHADDGIPTGVAATAPLAICMAALAAVRSTTTPCDTKEPAKCRHQNG